MDIGYEITLFNSLHFDSTFKKGTQFGTNLVNEKTYNHHSRVPKRSKTHGKILLDEILV